MENENKKEMWKKILTFVMQIIEIAISVFFGVKLTGII